MSTNQRKMDEARRLKGDLFGRVCEDCGRRLYDRSFKKGKGPDPDSAVLHHLDTTLRGTPDYWNFSDLSKFALLCPSCHAKRHNLKGSGWNWVKHKNKDKIIKKIRTTLIKNNFYNWCRKEALDALKTLNSIGTKKYRTTIEGIKNRAKGHLGITTAKKGKEYAHLWSWKVIETGEIIKKGMSYRGMSFYLLKKNNLIKKI